MRVTGFGDYIIHFSPEGYDRLWQAENMRISFTGAEANVCAALAFWGEKVSFVTRLPEHQLSRRAVSVMKSLDIDTSRICFGGERMGLCYLENGASVRASCVIYDRANSSFTEARSGDFDIDGIIDNTDILYLTGVTCALSENLFECCLALCKSAKERGVSVVFDVNYRSRLSSPERAAEFLRTMSPYISCLISNEEHLKLLLGISGKFGEDETEARLLDISRQARAVLSVPKIAVTVRRTISASDNVVYASYLDGDDFAVSKKHGVHIVDRVGSGDAFSAGLVYSMIHGYSVSDAVEFAAASNAIKHTIVNDINYASVDEIKRVLDGRFGDVRR
ncbi:MAG: sugar kinase [Clostridia bacterium]|nr:sugar kinase [Clostridia bacterium]